MPNIWTTDADRPRVLLRLLRLRAALPRAVPGRRCTRAMYGRSQGVQHVLRGTALGIALVGGGFLFKVWQPGAVPARRGRDDRGVRRGASSSCTRRRERGLARLRGRPQLREARAGRLPRGAGGAALPVRQRGVGGDVRGDADVRRPLHHEGARRVAVDVVGGARRRSPSATCSRRSARWQLGDRFGLARVILVASFVYGGGLLVAGPRAASGTAGTSGFILPVAVAGGHGDDALVGAALQADAARSTAARSPAWRRRPRGSGCCSARRSPGW